MANTLGAHLSAEITLNYTQSKISPSFGPEQSICMKRKKNCCRYASSILLDSPRFLPNLEMFRIFVFIY